MKSPKKKKIKNNKQQQRGGKKKKREKERKKENARTWKRDRRGNHMSADSRTKIFRAFNDSIKEVLIEFIVEPRASMLDIGRHNEEICSVLMKSDLKQYTFVESTYTNQIERREAWDKIMLIHKHSVGPHFKPIDVVDMVTTDFLTERISVDIKGKYKYVSCFDESQLMNGFNNKTKATNLIKNVADSLEPGGIFFGSVVDSAIVFSGVDRSSGRIIMANDMYKLEISTPSFKEFGTFVELRMNDSSEFLGSLVHFPTLINICKEYGLKMLEIQNFEEFYEDYEDIVEKKLMARGCHIRPEQLKPLRLYTTFVFKKF